MGSYLNDKLNSIFHWELKYFILIQKSVKSLVGYFAKTS